MRGKYSPTVTAAYMKDQKWWEKYSGNTDDEWHQYDPEGYDSYGYNADNRDRAGNHEYDYYHDDVVETNDELAWFSENYAYNNALDNWAFDGVKPVRRTK